MERIENNVISVVSQDICCGCGACINICPQEALSYSTDINGFIFPQIDKLLCVNCGKCMKVCPAIHVNKSDSLEAFAAVAKDKKSLFASSSGGVFSVIANYILKQGGIVYGCMMDDQFKVMHIRIDNKDQLPLLQKSKYVQSNLKSTYHLIQSDLNKGLTVLFSGTPCQVSAVKNYTSNNANLITIDIVCHGVPSQFLFDRYLSYLKEKRGELEKYEFRTKRIINNGMNWFFSYKLKSQKKAIVKNWPQDIYTYLYMKGYINRESCYNCKYTTKERPGDFTLCDYWKWENYHSCFDRNGTVSGILCNTQKAVGLLDLIKSNLMIEETDINNIIKHNSCLEKPVEKPERRDFVLKTINEVGFNVLDMDYRKKNRLNIIKNNIRMMLPQKMVNLINGIL